MPKTAEQIAKEVAPDGAASALVEEALNEPKPSAEEVAKLKRVKEFTNEFASTESQKRAMDKAFEDGTPAENILKQFWSKDEISHPVGLYYLGRIREVIG